MLNIIVFNYLGWCDHLYLIVTFFKLFSIPIIYCKSSAFRDGRAVTDADAVAEGTQNLFLTVSPTNHEHDLFSGISFILVLYSLFWYVNVSAKADDKSKR